MELFILGFACGAFVVAVFTYRMIFPRAEKDDQHSFGGTD